MLVLPYTGTKEHYDTELSYTPYMSPSHPAIAGPSVVWIRLGMTAATNMVSSQEVQNDLPIFHKFLRSSLNEIYSMGRNREELLINQDVPAVRDFVHAYDSGILRVQARIARSFLRHEVNRDWLRSLQSAYDGGPMGYINSVVTYENKDYEYPWESLIPPLENQGELSDLFALIETSEFAGLMTTNRIFQIGAQAKSNPRRK